MTHLLTVSRRRFVSLFTALGASVLGVFRLGSGRTARRIGRRTLGAVKPRRGVAQSSRPATNGLRPGGRRVRGERRPISGNSPKVSIRLRRSSAAPIRAWRPRSCSTSARATSSSSALPGNVVSGAGAVVKGSIEYAVAELKVPLIMVLGHTNCGAVKAAIAHLKAKDSLPGAINDLVELIKPAVEQSKGESADPLSSAISKNVQLGVERLKGLEPILAAAGKGRKAQSRWRRVRSSHREGDVWSSSGCRLRTLSLVANASDDWHGSSTTQSNSSRRIVASFIRHRMAAGEIGIAVNGGAKVRQTDATRAAVVARAIADHFQADRQHLRHLA